jgi:hypothetical protein
LFLFAFQIDKTAISNQQLGLFRNQSGEKVPRKKTDVNTDKFSLENPDLASVTAEKIPEFDVCRFSYLRWAAASKLARRGK